MRFLHLFDKFSFDAQERQILGEARDAKTLIATLEKLGTPTEKHAALLTELRGYGTVTQKIQAILKPYLPQFMYFANYDRMEGAVQIEQLNGLVSNGQIDADEHRGRKLFREFFEYAGVPLNEIQSVTTYETAARQWLAEREADLVPLPYYHVVFTLPSAIGAVAWQNKAEVYGLLFKAASEAMLTIAADPEHLGARIGVTAVLHTWGSALTHHPHVHMIVPGGGLSLDGERFIPCRRRFFLPVRVLSRLFRRLFLERLAAA